MNPPPLPTTDQRARHEAADSYAGLIALGAIVTAALAVRLIYLFQISTIPFFTELVSDAEAYDAWARRIAAGHWQDGPPFYQAPAYPYFLAAIKVALGDSPVVTRLVQCALGSVACGLVGLAAWRLVSRSAGLWAAGLLAVYPPAICFDGLIQKASLGQFLAAALLAIVAWMHWGKARLWAALLAGLVLGVYALTRENALVLVPLVGAWLWLGSARESLGRRIGALGLLLLGLGIALVPVGLHNRRAGGEFALTTFQAGPNFYIGNNAAATGRYRPLVSGHATPEFERQDATALAEQARGRSLSPPQVSDYWMDQAMRFIRGQPLAWIKLLGVKWSLVWNAYEIPDTESYYIYAEWSWLLGLLGGFLHFGVLTPLAAGGVVLTWSRRREVWVLWCWVLVIAVAVALFYVFARYRYPLVPVLVIFAGAGLAEGWAAWGATQYRRLAKASLCAALVAVACNLRVNPEEQLNAMAWGNLGGALARQGKIAQAVPFFERAVEGAPTSAEMRYNLGLAYTRQQRLSDAVGQFTSALQLHPNLPEVDFQLGAVLERLGRPTDALHHYRRAVARDPDDADARAGMTRLSE